MSPACCTLCVELHLSLSRDHVFLVMRLECLKSSTVTKCLNPLIVRIVWVLLCGQYIWGNSDSPSPCSSLRMLRRRVLLYCPVTAVFLQKQFQKQVCLCSSILYLWNLPANYKLGFLYTNFISVHWSPFWKHTLVPGWDKTRVLFESSAIHRMHQVACFHFQSKQPYRAVHIQPKPPFAFRISADILKSSSLSVFYCQNMSEVLLCYSFHSSSSLLLVLRFNCEVKH